MQTWKTLVNITIIVIIMRTEGGGGGGGGRYYETLRVLCSDKYVRDVVSLTLISV